MGSEVVFGEWQIVHVKWIFNMKTGGTTEPKKIAPASRATAREANLTGSQISETSHARNPNLNPKPQRSHCTHGPDRCPPPNTQILLRAQLNSQNSCGTA